jgi:hypothetical protein
MARELERQMIIRVYKDDGAKPIKDDFAALRRVNPGRNDSQIAVDLIRKAAERARRKG